MTTECDLKEPNLQEEIHLDKPDPASDPEDQLSVLNRNLRRIEFLMKIEVANNLSADNASLFPDPKEANKASFWDGIIAHENLWDYVTLPLTKNEAIKILENPDKSRLDKLSAYYYAEIWKKSQIRKRNGLPLPENAILIPSFDQDVD